MALIFLALTASGHCRVCHTIVVDELVAYCGDCDQWVQQHLRDKENRKRKADKAKIVAKGLLLFW